MLELAKTLLNSFSSSGKSPREAAFASNIYLVISLHNRSCDREVKLAHVYRSKTYLLISSSIASTYKMFIMIGRALVY